mgnify:CR=1 FL=1
MLEAISAYNKSQSPEWQPVCIRLAHEIAVGLPEAEPRIWHRAPVWFLKGNPVVGYWVRKSAVQLLFWSGQSFGEEGLRPEGKFKAADACFARAEDIDSAALARWLVKARTIQWDYKNIVKRRGALEWLVRQDSA